MIDDKLALVNARLAGVTCALGWVHVPELSVPPRLVWTSSPSGDQFLPATDLGTNEYTAIADHWVALEAHVWAFSGEQLTAILHNLVLACREVFYGPQMKIGVAKWGKDQRVDLGLVAILPISVKIPVLDEYVDLPPTPADVAVQPGPATTVTVIASGTPGTAQVIPEIHSATFDTRRP